MPFRLRLAVTVALLLGACGQRWPDRIDLADLVAHQRHNVERSVLFSPGAADRAWLRRGWVVDPDDRHLQMTGRRSLVHFFSARGEATRLTLDAELDASAAGATDDPLVRLLLNGRGVARTELLPGRHSYELELPTARRGANALELQLEPRELRARDDAGSGLLVHGLALRSAGRRPREGTGPGRIEVASGRRTGERTVALPTASFLDAVAVIADPARFEARVAAAGDETVELYVELLDESGGTYELHRAPAGDRGRLEIDLEPWRGQLVRLRVGAEGDATGVAMLSRARLSGRPDGGSPAAEPPATADLPHLGRPDIVLVLLDAARADAFGCYGGPYPTPTLDALAAGGTRFARALSAAPWTGQSVPSLLTGLYPDALGIERWGSRLPAATVGLADRLRDAGYRTLLWSQHPFYRHRKDLKRGFDAFALTEPEDRREILSDPGWLFPEEEGEQPIFALLHLLPPHTPYDPPAPFRGAYTGWYRGDARVDAAYLHRFPAKEDPNDLDPDDLRYIRDRYLENVAFADSLVAQLLDLLDQRGRLDEALVVVVADHGEAFLEHGRFMHGQKLHTETLHVPLVIKWPSRVSGFRPVVDHTVSLADVTPTLLAALGLDGDGLHGVSLLPSVFADARPERSIYATTGGSAASGAARTRATLESGGWKLIWDGDSLETELYRLADDPGEQRNLAAEHPVRALLLEQMLLMRRELHRQTLARLGGSEAEALDPETAERLRALGYL